MSLEPRSLARIIRSALEEDIGSGDVTTRWAVPERATARAELVARAEGVIAGLPVAALVLRAVDPEIELVSRVEDGARVTPGQVLAEAAGPARGVLTGERTALNFLQRMSGIATLTARYCAAVEGTGARILDTRKTAPGLRALDKYAVRAGGGTNHRAGLYDMVLLKENHLEAAGGIEKAIAAVRAGMEEAGLRLAVEVEVESLEAFEIALAAGADWIMLDNLAPEVMREAAGRARARGGSRPRLEASGNVTLETVRAVAETGVDYVSVGALTHSPPALDLSLLIR